MTLILRISTQHIFLILPTLLLLTQCGSEARPQQNEEAFYPQPPSSVQITKERVIQIQPKGINLANITAHTQEILAKIDEVNRQHGYRKPEMPKRSHFVPGYFTNNYNYKERLLKGFAPDEAPQLDQSQGYSDLLSKFQPKLEELTTTERKKLVEDSKKSSVAPSIVKKHALGMLEDAMMQQENLQMHDLQAQLSVDHVKQIVQNYPYPATYSFPVPQIYPGFAGYYKPYYQPYHSPNIYMPDPTQATNVRNSGTSTITFNPFYAPYLVPLEVLPQIYAPITQKTSITPIAFNPEYRSYPNFKLNPNELVPIIYIAYWIECSPTKPSQEENCGNPVEDNAKRAPKILEKSKILPTLMEETLPRSTPLEKDSTFITTTNIPEPPKHNNKVVIENVDLPAGDSKNKTQILSLINYSSAERRKVNRQQIRQQQQAQRQTSDNRRNTKRPSIFRPHTWFNNQPMLNNNSKNQTEVGEASDEVAESISIEGGESHKGLGLFAHNNRRKIFGKDNTGSGIFIHKLKVRKGGVAIAGPGGIATAGSGGTAIVGPNGYAFTHPDSLAIAGSGTKVIAVDPNINLSDLVNNGTLNATTRARVGKVVATGPVVYYNKG